MQCTIQHLTGSKQGQVEQFNEERITVGRNPTNRLVYDPYYDIQVSGDHAQFSVGPDGKLYLTDLGSSNGTFLNGQRVGGQPMPCEPGSKVKFGADGPECKVDYVPVVKAAPARPGATREMLAKMQDDLAAEKKKNEESKQRSFLVMGIVAVVLLIGSLAGGLFMSHSKKKNDAIAAIKLIEEARDDAVTSHAEKHAAAAWENAEALRKDAGAAFEAGTYKECSETAEGARLAYRNAAKVGRILGEVADRREEARIKYAHLRAKDQYDQAAAKEEEAKKQIEAGDFDGAVRAGEAAKGLYADAAKKAYVDVLTEMRNDQERAKAEAAAAAAEQERKVREAEAAVAAATEESKARLEEEVRKLRAQKPDSVRVQEAVAHARAKVVLIEAELVAVSNDTKSEFPLDRKVYGSGFLYEGDQLITAKRTLLPYLFDADLRALEEQLKKLGRSMKARYKVFVFAKDSYKLAFSSEKGNVELGKVGKDVFLVDPVKGTVDDGGTTKEVAVTIHDPLKGNVATLKLTLEGARPPALTGEETAAVRQQLLVAVGAVMEEAGAGPAELSGPVAQIHDVRGTRVLEITTTFTAPDAMVGGPILSLDQGVVGVVVQIEKAHVKFVPIAVAQKMLEE